ncbi:hypothetical protein F2Q69_00053425 [Brassica cretica]|uniref:Uncharacterized protein n=1 Tax=Brassica cretica TaxID=69181 RepID=A0A8S9N354_BRACR|nr:hypothetical protein F2Q69_00053425 [Brassica cretica]
MIARSLCSDRAGRSLRSDRASARAQSLRNDRDLARARSLRSDRAGLALGRYVAIELDERSLRSSDRALARALSLRSDLAGRVLSRYVATELLTRGRFVATELWLELGCYAATGQRVCVVITQQSSLVSLV